MNDWGDLVLLGAVVGNHCCNQGRTEGAIWTRYGPGCNSTPTAGPVLTLTLTGKDVHGTYNQSNIKGAVLKLRYVAMAIF